MTKWLSTQSKRHNSARPQKQKEINRRVFFEALEERHLLAIVFADDHFVGGSGDQAGTDVTISGSQILLSANRQASQTSTDSSILARFNAPTTGVSSPAWQTTFTRGTTFGVAADGTSVYGVGWSHPGSGSGTIDNSGGTEVKAIVTKAYTSSGGLDGSFGSGGISFPPVAFNSSPGTDFFAYDGVEEQDKALVNVESGTPYIYAVGGGQPASYRGYVVGKYNAATGALVNAATDSTVGLSFNVQFVPSAGGSTANGIAVVGVNLFVAGSSGWSHEGDGGVSRPTIWRYNTSLGLLGRTKDSSLNGTFNNVTSFGGAAYAVGQTGTGGSEDFLIEKFDASGTRLWTTNPIQAGSQQLFGVVGIGSTLYAVGNSNSIGAGGKDAVILEIDPSTGAILSTTTYGGVNDDLFKGVVADGTDLYAVGESRSFTAGGNLSGQNDAVLVHYTTLAGTLSASLSGGNLTIADTDATGKNNNLTAKRVNIAGTDYVEFTDAAEQFTGVPSTVPVSTLSNSNKTLRVPLSAISGSITVNGAGGNDTLTVDSSMTASGKPIVFNGGDPTSGPPGDAMVISGFGAFTDIAHSFSSAANGSVDIDGYAITYTGLEPVTDNLSATNRVFTFLGAAETVTLADDATPGNTMSVISSTLGESVTFANPTGSLTVNLTNDSDTLNFNSLDSKEPSPLGPVVAGLVVGDLVVADVNGATGGPIGSPPGSRIIKVDPVSGAQTLISTGGYLDLPYALAIDPIGMIVVADQPPTPGGLAQIVLVHPVSGAQTVLSTGGLITNPSGLTIDASGNILVADPSYSIGGATGAIIKVDRLTGTQSVAAVGGYIKGPVDVTLDAAGNMFVAIAGSPTGVGVVKVAPGGAQTLVSPGGASSWTGGIVVDSAGTIYTSEIYYTNGIFKINPITGAQSVLTSGVYFQDPWDLAIESSGKLIVADGNWYGAGEVIRVDPVTGVQTLVSSGGMLVDPFDIAVKQSVVLSSFSAHLVINGDGGDSVNFSTSMINLGAGNANLGTTGGQPIQDINFTGGGLQTTSGVFLTVTGTIATTTTAIDVVANSLTATAATGIDLDTTVTSISDTITAAGNIQVDETDGLSDLLLDAGAGNVTLTTGGAIVDTSGDGNDIVATNLLLKSTGGIGVSGNPIEVAVTNADIANIASGGIFVTDTAGGLILLDSALDADALAVSGVGGNGLITALSPLTIASDATTSGGLTYASTDSGSTGDDLTINAGVTVSDSTSSLTFNAGDNFKLFDTAAISTPFAGSTVTINIDFGNVDAGGATADINGALAAASGALLTGNSDNDTFNITGPSATALDSITAAVTVNGGGGTNNLTLSDANDATPGDTATITHTTVEGLGGSPGIDYTFSNIANLDVTATSATDTLTTNLGTGPAASPTNFNSLVTVNVRGNGGDDNMFLHVADSLTNASLDFVRLFGDAGGDNFGGPASLDHIRPVLLTGQTQIIINGDAEAKLGPSPVNPGTTGTLTATDRLYLDVTTTDSGAATLPVVIVDTNGGYADTANTVSFRYNGIEDIDLYDGGGLTNTTIGDFLLRATDQPDYIQFVSASQVNPIFRIRVGNLYYPTGGGNYGPYTTGTSKIFVYGRGGNDTISMYNTRLNAAFFGEGGDDILTGGYGDDLLVGGSGNDRINGGAVGGSDEVWGDDFNPATDNPAVASQAATVPGKDNDQINTYGGNDTVYGQGGNDIILTGGGDDYINGGAGDDQIDGQAGNDRIYGGAGNDVATGSDGNDVVAGNDGIDTLYGRLGNDILIGGLGQDILNGNEGGDALVGDESVYSGQSSQSLAKNDARDAALLALLTLWGPTPTMASLGTLDSAGTDGSVDTLWGGADADAFFGIGALLDIAADRVVVGFGADLN